MAVVANNILTNGLSGVLGKTLVFKKVRNKTVVASYSAPSKKQSEAQKTNRSRFRQASNWAQITLQDPAQKAYYQKKAKKLHLPNAYTAAITDFMRKPRIQQLGQNGAAIFCVSKKDFAIEKAEINFITTDGRSETRTVPANALGECMVSFSESDQQQIGVLPSSISIKAYYLIVMNYEFPNRISLY